MTPALTLDIHDFSDPSLPAFLLPSFLPPSPAPSLPPLPPCLPALPALPCLPQDSTLDAFSACFSSDCVPPPVADFICTNGTMDHDHEEEQWLKDAEKAEVRQHNRCRSSSYD